MKKLAIILCFVFMIFSFTTVFAAGSKGDVGIETNDDDNNSGTTQVVNKQTATETVETVVSESAGSLLSEDAAAVVAAVNSATTSTDASSALSVEQVVDALSATVSEDVSSYSFVTDFADVYTRITDANGKTTTVADSPIQNAKITVSNLTNFTEAQVKADYKVMLIGTDGKVYFLPIKGFNPVTGEIIADLPCGGSIAIVSTK